VSIPVSATTHNFLQKIHKNEPFPFPLPCGGRIEGRGIAFNRDLQKSLERDKNSLDNAKDLYYRKE